MFGLVPREVHVTEEGAVPSMEQALFPAQIGTHAFLEF